MTVNELFGTWLHNANPKADCRVWDKTLGEYVFSTRKPIPNQNVKNIATKEVQCFYAYYVKETDTETLIININ